MSLPHGFDLLYDIKELSELKREYWWSKQKTDGIEEMAREHGIDLGEHPPWEYCVDCNERVELDFKLRCKTCTEDMVGKVCVVCDDEAKLNDKGWCAECVVVGNMRFG